MCLMSTGSSPKVVLFCDILHTSCYKALEFYSMERKHCTGIWHSISYMFKTNEFL